MVNKLVPNRQDILLEDNTKILKYRVLMHEQLSIWTEETTIMNECCKRR